MTQDHQEQEPRPRPSAIRSRRALLVHADEVKFTQYANGDWRWHRQAPNGKIISESGEGYRNLDDCVDMAVRVNGWPVRY